MPCPKLKKSPNTCAEILGIKHSAGAHVKRLSPPLVQWLVSLQWLEEISIAHQIPTYKEDAPPKIIVKFARRDIRNRFYGSRSKLANKKIQDLPDLNLTSTENVYISESLTPYKMELFSE